MTATLETNPQPSPHLKQGSFNWVVLAGLGVSFVISGDFAGWQFGLGSGGWGGLFCALLIVAVLYMGMCLALAELSAALPSAGGGHLFAQVAVGDFAGFMTAIAILLEYVLAPRPSQPSSAVMLNPSISRMLPQDGPFISSATSRLSLSTWQALAKPSKRCASSPSSPSLHWCCTPW